MSTPQPTPLRRPDLGTIGVWCPQLRTRSRPKCEAVARGLEELGFTTLWIPGGTGGAVFEHVTNALRATRAVPIATGVVNMLMHEPEEAADWFAAMEDEFPGRLMLGVGASHAKRAAAVGRPYRPMATTRDYFRRLDSASAPVPRSRRILGALGPRMLELAREKADGAHTYVVDPSHTRLARTVLGPDRFLAPVVKVVNESDPAMASAVAREHLAPYLALPSYRQNLLRMGYTEADFADGGSERLIYELVVFADMAVTVDRIAAHLDSGADHVCVQVVTADRQDVPWGTWRDIASVVKASFPTMTGPLP